MKLSKEAIEDFKKIYKEEFGEEINNAEAQELGLNLLYLMKIIYPPTNKNEELK